MVKAANRAAAKCRQAWKSNPLDTQAPHGLEIYRILLIRSILDKEALHEGRSVQGHGEAEREKKGKRERDRD